jgi:hypothetical protein
MFEGEFADKITHREQIFLGRDFDEKRNISSGQPMKVKDWPMGTDFNIAPEISHVGFRAQRLG